MTRIRWQFPNDLIATSVEIMRPQGELGNEGLALWFGNEDQGVAKITHVIEVFGTGFSSAPLQLQLSMRALESLIDLADSIGSFLVGQIHSHPGMMLDLSLADVTYGIRRQDYLSVVCPFYAQRPATGLQECGIHLFDQGRYRRLPPAESAQRIDVISAPVKWVRHEVHR